MRSISLLMLATLCAIILQPQEAYASRCKQYRGGRKSFFGFQVHTYACCNNCGQSDTRCNGKTYHGGSNGRYCGSCGRDSWGGKYKRSFQCVNCNTQNACESRANIFDWPGGCWLWMGSFRGCCRRAANYGRRRQTIPLNITTMEFCGDTVCQSNENPENCPMDCCSKMNSICDLTEQSPECCGEQGCCMQNAPGESGAGNPTILTYGLLLAVLFTFCMVV